MSATPSPFAGISPTTLADLLGPEQVVHPAIRPLWDGAPPLAGPAYAVRCGPGDNLMVHASIYRAPAGSVLVVQSGDRWDPHGGTPLAVAGGNVCAVAQQRGIAGMVVDGVIRDLAEIRERGFAVHARGVAPKPGAKGVYLPPGEAVVGGVTVRTGDVVVADEEGVVVVPAAAADDLAERARARQEHQDARPLEDWATAHRRRIAQALAEAGDPDGLPG